MESAAPRHLDEFKWKQQPQSTYKEGSVRSNSTAVFFPVILPLSVQTVSHILEYRVLGKSLIYNQVV